MKKALSLILALVLCLSLCACGEGTPTVPDDIEPSATVHTHNWSDATCDTPKTCVDCGATDGSPKDHDWKDATCDAPKTCETCGQTEGEKLKHQWERNTCTDPYTCSLCSATIGEGDKHYVYNGICEVCGKAVEEIEKEPGYQYQLALELLSYGSDNEKAYRLLSALGDYKDAAEHLSRFVVIPDVLLYWIYEKYNAFGELSDTCNAYYHYDSSGRVVVAPAASYYNGAYFDQKIEYTYDDNGRVLETMHTSTRIKTHYTYNSDGQLAETKGVHSDGTTSSITNYSYNEAGQMVKEERKDANGIIRVTEYTYDNKGQVIREDYPNSIYIAKIYEYDDEGHLIKEISDYDKHVRVAYHYENGILVSAEYDGYTTEYVYGDYYCYIPAE